MSTVRPRAGYQRVAGVTYDACVRIRDDRRNRRLRMAYHDGVLDNWGSSHSKLPLYAGLGVPEVWRYRVRRRKLWFGRLAGDRYEPTDRTLLLPGLTPAIVLELLERGAKTPAAAWSKWLLTEWFPSHRAEMGL